MAAQIILPYSLHDDLLTVDQSAELAGVSVQVVRNWSSRGYLDPALGCRVWLRTFRTEAGRPRHRGIDVLRAEAATRRRARRLLDVDA